ncbi:MAG: hypothetical protein ABJB47_04610 [Actinomycetota bacterium]
MTFTAGEFSAGRDAAPAGDPPAAASAADTADLARPGPGRPKLPRRADAGGPPVPATPNAEPVPPDVLHRVLDRLQEL